MKASLLLGLVEIGGGDAALVIGCDLALLRVLHCLCALLAYLKRLLSFDLTILRGDRRFLLLLH